MQCARQYFGQEHAALVTKDRLAVLTYLGWEGRWGRRSALAARPRYVIECATSLLVAGGFAISNVTYDNMMLLEQPAVVTYDNIMLY